MTSKSENPKIAAIGASSMVGSRYSELAQGSLDLVKADLSGEIQVDITSAASAYEFFKEFDFSHVILFSAFTDVDAAEKQRDKKNDSCWKINVEGVKNIVRACIKYQRKLIFISTDFVFDGANGPYQEDDQPGPNMDLVSWYGITKIEAEKFIHKFLPSALIIRIAYPYRAKYEGKDDIVKKILRLYREKKLYAMFSDQTFTPTFIDDLAASIALLIKKDQEGIYHVASPEPTTLYAFAKHLIAIFGGDPKEVEEGTLSEFLKTDYATPRPVNGGLKVEKISSLGFVPTTWQKGIEIIRDQSNGQLI